MAAYRMAPRPQPHAPRNAGVSPARLLAAGLLRDSRGTALHRAGTARRRRFCATGAAALGLLAFALAPSAAAAEDAVPIGAAAALPPGIVAPGSIMPPSASAPQPSPPPQLPGNPELSALLYGSDAPTVAGEPLRHPDLVRRFYAEHGNEPFWDGHAEAARALLGAVFGAEDQGLDPALFHAAVLSRGDMPLSPVARDVLVTDAVLSYADALAEGAVPRAERPATEALHPMPIDVVAAVDQAIAAPDPARGVAALAPSSPAYETLRRAYAYYRALAAGTPVARGATAAANYENGSSEPPPSYDQYGSESYPPYGGYAGDNRYRSDSRYQGYAGYSPVSPWLAARRARQLAVALERLRWLPRNPPPERIMVNTATQQLRYFVDDRPVFTTRVVVGEPTWQTPEFHATIDDVLFNPPWRVPPNIMRKEILPKLARDPGYLARHHMRWIGPTQVEQVAGPYSSLGRLKFEMSDPYDVYLHDTPEKHLFRLANRMKSHGCVRVEYPQELAVLLLHESPFAVARGIAEGRTHAEALPQPVDAYIIYRTVSVGPSGEIVFHADPYHRDSEIWQLLNRPGGLPVAQDDGIDARKG